MTAITQKPGSALPLGANRSPQGINFAVVSQPATAVTLCLFRANKQHPSEQIALDPRKNRTGDIWHIALDNIDDYVGYSYRVDGSHDLLDPYAKGVIARRFPPLELYSPIGALPPKEQFDWEGDQRLELAWSDLVIYEMHVAGFTQDQNSHVQHPGTYLGFIEKIPHLVDLGITAVELMPVFEFDQREGERSCIATQEVLGNYWGYSTVNFFTPMTHFAASRDPGASINEFKQMVKALHKAGIEVILDVVYNHTAEGDQRGATYSFRGFDPSSYYMLDSQGSYLNYTGCGNTFRCNHPLTRELIIASLRYWVDEMHVDGFRFDLAAILTRDRRGNPQPYSPILETIGDDPVLAKVKLIAEPWDAAGLYQVGVFWPMGRRWSEWNGKYRDALRRFIKGDGTVKGDFATRICGSEDLYGDQGSPRNSINFVTAHDGFTLADLVSYNEKHNEANGEGSRDGTNDNLSWNCGAEGPTIDPKILSRRERQKRNFLVAMMISRGVPMLLMGDEYGHTKDGDNNTWCRNDASNWLQWGQLQENEGFYRFCKSLVALRKTYGVLRREAFYSRHDVQWHGLKPNQPDWGSEASIIALSLHDRVSANYLYVAFNASDKPQEFTLPELPYGLQWAWIANTAEKSPRDFPSDAAVPVGSPIVSICDHSCIILKG